jgi:hypothetical protein
MALATGTRVRTKEATPSIEAGSEGVIVHWDSWSGEDYPYTVHFDNGLMSAFARHELQVI